MSTKHDRMHEQILEHGLKLNRLFRLNRPDPMTLCRQVHRLEVKAHRLAEDDCNGLIESEEKGERKENAILKSLNRILNFQAQNIPVFFNGDPRGYALKIKPEWMKKHNADLHCDWGGYGIIAPDFDGS